MSESVCKKYVSIQTTEKWEIITWSQMLECYETQSLQNLGAVVELEHHLAHYKIRISKMKVLQNLFCNVGREFWGTSFIFLGGCLKGMSIQAGPGPLIF